MAVTERAFTGLRPKRAEARGARSATGRAASDIEESWAAAIVLGGCVCVCGEVWRVVATRHSRHPRVAHTRSLAIPETPLKFLP